MSTGTAPQSAISAVELGDDSPFFEIIDGKIVEMPPMSSYAIRIANKLAYEMQTHARANNLGEAIVEQIFNLRLPLDRNRRPDAAFVSHKRWPKDRPMPMEGDVWDVVPDLMIEVVSPNDKAEELQTKMREYFEAGARQVWIIYPRERVAYIHTSRLECQGVSDTGDLTGGDVLPGFLLPLAQLFPPRIEPVPNG